MWSSNSSVWVPGGMIPLVLSKSRLVASPRSAPLGPLMSLASDDTSNVWAPDASPAIGPPAKKLFPGGDAIGSLKDGNPPESIWYCTAVNTVDPLSELQSGTGTVVFASLAPAPDSASPWVTQLL